MWCVQDGVTKPIYRKNIEKKKTDTDIHVVREEKMEESEKVWGGVGECMVTSTVCNISHTYSSQTA